MPSGSSRQGLQNVFGRELRVPLPHRDGLRRLQEAARPLGVAFEIHPQSPSTFYTLIFKIVTCIELEQSRDRQRHRAI